MYGKLGAVRWNARLALSGLFLALLSGAALPARAGDGVWTPFGPPGSGGGLRVLAADPVTPGTLYADAGITDLVRSADGGRTWTWSGSGLQGNLPFAIVIDPAHPSTLYCTGSTGLFRSDDGARHWRLLARTSGSGSAALIYVLAASPGVVFATTANILERSTDGGVTWTTIFPELPLTVQVSRTDPRRVYLLTSRGEIFQSADGGDSWAPTGPVASGPPFQPLATSALAVAPSDALTLYAENGRTLYRSTDGGAHWASVSARPADASAFDTLIVDPAVKAHLYALTGHAGAAVFFSANGGAIIRQVTSGVPARFYWAVGLAFDAAGHVAYAGSTPAVRLRGVRGDWTQGAPTGLPVGIFHFMKFSPADPATIYVGHDYGLSVSHDGGQTWSLLSSRGDLSDLELDAASPDTLVAAADSGVLRSTDGGRTWTLLSPADLLPIAVLRRGGALIAGGNGIYRSADGGATWTELLSSVFAVQRLIADPTNPAVAYALIQELVPNPGPGPFYTLYVTRDSGLSWQQLDIGTVAFAVDPTNTATLYEGFPDGHVRRSTDGGLTWQPAATLPAPVSDLLVDPAMPSTVYAATQGRGVLRSLDHGLTWTAIDAGLWARWRLWIARLIADPAVPHQLYAAPSASLPGSGGTGLFAGRFSGSS
ncbi:MAG TPA: hypothetical protein VGH73_16360 [Thermoanaerobaculia bacterium]|jgi:photosystem II stability/assembly factor-like uncharacterized protein